MAFHLEFRNLMHYFDRWSAIALCITATSAKIIPILYQIAVCIVTRLLAWLVEQVFTISLHNVALPLSLTRPSPYMGTNRTAPSHRLMPQSDDASNTAWAEHFPDNPVLRAVTNSGWFGWFIYNPGKCLSRNLVWYHQKQGKRQPVGIFEAGFQANRPA